MSTRTSKSEGKRSLREMSEEEEEEEEDEDEGVDTLEEEEALEKKQKSMGTSSGGGICQVESCGADMRTAKTYHKRHKVCEFHAKASLVRISGLDQRFCQQCSRFHEVGEFDEAKRSCRRRLAGHNQRRRKSATE